MPNAVTHVILTMVLVALFRDYVAHKKKFTLNMVFLGGVAGLLPDIDIPLYWLLHDFLGLQIPYFHRLFTHSIVFVLLFLLLGVFFLFRNKHVAILFFIVTFGVLFHVFLDFLLLGNIMPFYPFSLVEYGVNLLSYVKLSGFVAGIDAFVLLAWLFYEERKHKILDFI